VNVRFGWKADATSVPAKAAGLADLEGRPLLDKRNGATRLAIIYVCPSRRHFTHGTIRKAHSHNRKVPACDAPGRYCSELQNFCSNDSSVRDDSAKLEISDGSHKHEKSDQRDRLRGTVPERVSSKCIIHSAMMF